MPELGPDRIEQPAVAEVEVRPEAEVIAEGAAQAAAVGRLEGEHAALEDPVRRCADIKLWVEAECDYFGIEPKNDPVADQLTEFLFAYEVEQLGLGRADYDVTAERRRSLDRIIERGFTLEAEEAEIAEAEVVVEAEAEETEAEAAATEEVVADASAYEALLQSPEYLQKSNVDKIAMMTSHPDVPESERAKWASFRRIMAIADRVPTDAPIIRQRFNQIDMTQGVPDPVQFIQTAIFSSPDYDTGVSQATQDAIAAEFNLTPTRPDQPRNASEMQTTLREGRGTREITEIQEVEEPPGSGNWVEKEVVVGEEPIPFDETEPLVLSSGNPRVVAYPDPPGSDTYRFVGEVEGTAPVSIHRLIPASGAFPAASINNDMNEMLLDTVLRSNNLGGGLQGLLGLSDGTLGVTTDIDSNAPGRVEVTQAFLSMCLGENTTLNNRFLTGSELSALQHEIRHLVPDGDFGAFNRVDPTTATNMMQALFGSDVAQMRENMSRARPFINTGGAEQPSYQRLYALMYPEDAANGYARLRGIIGDDGLASLNFTSDQPA